MPEDIRENLVDIDLEAVNSLYTDNLKQAFDNAQRAIKTNAGFRQFPRSRHVQVRRRESAARSAAGRRRMGH